MTERTMDKYVTAGGLSLIVACIAMIPVSYLFQSAVPIIVVSCGVVLWAIPIIVHIWRS